MNTSTKYHGVQRGLPSSAIPEDSLLDRLPTSHSLQLPLAQRLARVASRGTLGDSNGTPKKNLMGTSPGVIAHPIDLSADRVGIGATHTIGAASGFASHPENLTTCVQFDPESFLL